MKIELSNRELEIAQNNQWQAVAKIAHDFLDSLPHGWLAHTSGDVGLLNDFYIAYRAASNLGTTNTQKAIRNLMQNHEH